MRTFDLTPLFRSTVGFDRLSRAVDTALQLNENTVAYPPYNIEKLGDDKYRIAMAVAGFAVGDIEIITHESVLTVKGKANPENGDRTYLYRGIAERAFERKFQLADFIKVTDARLADGLLHIELVREIPDELKPRRIAVTAGTGPQAAAAVDHKKAA